MLLTNTCRGGGTICIPFSWQTSLKLYCYIIGFREEKGADGVVEWKPVYCGDADKSYPHNKIVYERRETNTKDGFVRPLCECSFDSMAYASPSAANGESRRRSERKKKK